MDSWVIALTKYCQNVARNRKCYAESSYGVSDYGISESSLSTYAVRRNRCPLRGLIRKKKFGGNVSKEEETISDTHFRDGEDRETFGDVDSVNVGPRPSSESSLMGNVELQENEGVSNDIGDNSAVIASHFIWGKSRNGCACRFKASRSQIVKPVNSLESCLMAQLYMEQAEKEEYTIYSLKSAFVPTVSSLFVNDGSRIFFGSSMGNPFRAEVNWEESRVLGNNYCCSIPTEEKETVIGVPSLPKRGKQQHGQSGTSNKGINGKCCHSQGSIDGSFLFYLGLSIGIISAVISNKKEVRKLTDSLIHNENLVLDLQDELEMKDLLTVKELNFEPLNSHDYSLNNKAQNAFFSEDGLYKSRKCDDIEKQDLKAEGESQSISNIEAELEAELERLELSMNTSGLKAKLSDHIEPLSEYAPFELGIIPDRNTTKYAVSPQELTLRLHEVIQKRLEIRVKDLETALDSSKRKIRSLELERTKSCTNFSDSKLVSTSTRDLDDACNEASEELLNVNVSENECSASGVDIMKTSDPSIVLEGNRSIVGELNDVSISRDGYSDCDDETEILLLKQILEKTRKKSPAILNAQRLLVQLDEDEL